MAHFGSIKDNLSQIFALTEKNIKLYLRYKFTLIVSYITPLLAIFMPLVILRKFFTYNLEFGPWNETTFLLYQIIAFNVTLLQRIITEFPEIIRSEKYWKTLSAIIIAPYNRFYLIFGIFFTQMFLIIIPFIVCFIIGCIIYPISFFTLLFILGIYLSIALIFSGIGLILGIFIISIENIWKIFTFGVSFAFVLSCLTYPFEVFPEYFQPIINLNPLYYLFDILRYAWIENNVLITLNSHPFHFLVLISALIVIPIIGVYIFNLIFKKYGIAGY